MLTVHAAPLYQQDFLNNTGSNQATSYVSWNTYLGSSATVISGVVAGNEQNRAGLASAAGNPNTSNGFFFAVNQVTPDLVFATTTTFTSIAPTTISWKQGNGSTSAVVRVMVQAGGSWYASNDTFSNTSTYTASTFSSSTSADISKTFTFTTAAASWRSVTLVPGSSLSLGSVLTTDLTSSSITGIGFYLQMPTALTTAVRLDTLTVVPEPHTGVLVGLGLIGFLLFRRRGQFCR